MLLFVIDACEECPVLSHFPTPCGSVQASELESQPAPNSYTALVSGSQMESRKWGRGWNGGSTAAALGEQDWLMLWLEHSWAAPSKDKNKRDSNSVVAGCLGTDSLDCIAGMMALLLLPLLQALAWCPFVAELYPDRPGSWCSGPPGWKLISSCYQKAAHPNSGVPHPQTLTLIIFPSPVSASGGQCLSFAP